MFIQSFILGLYSIIMILLFIYNSFIKKNNDKYYKRISDKQRKFLHIHNIAKFRNIIFDYCDSLELSELKYEIEVNDFKYIDQLLQIKNKIDNYYNEYNNESDEDEEESETSNYLDDKNNGKVAESSTECSRCYDDSTSESDESTDNDNETDESTTDTVDADNESIVPETDENIINTANKTIEDDIDKLINKSDDKYIESKTIDDEIKNEEGKIYILDY